MACSLKPVQTSHLFSAWHDFYDNLVNTKHPGIKIIPEYTSLKGNAVMISMPSPTCMISGETSVMNW
jgi:hypothetical protein